MGSAEVLSVAQRLKHSAIFFSKQEISRKTGPDL